MTKRKTREHRLKKKEQKKQKRQAASSEDEGPETEAKACKESRAVARELKQAQDEAHEEAVAALDSEGDEEEEEVADEEKKNLKALEKGQEVAASADVPDEDEAPADPYLLADAAYIQKDTRWRNKQRTLVFLSRGVTKRFRHLCEDIKKLLPHHKSEPKFEKKDRLQEINEICELKGCNNVIFFEARKMEHFYMHIGRVPGGPTFKFQVRNIHTTSEIRLAGNCLLGSRPLLHFDKCFDTRPQLRLLKTLFTQVFGTPRNHPKSKPFHDHMLNFSYLDGKIWFRHYQIQPETSEFANDPEHQLLTEIGPRFVLEPIRILSGSFGGQSIWVSPNYLSPRAMRVHAKQMMRDPQMSKLTQDAQRREKYKGFGLPEDPTNQVFA